MEGSPRRSPTSKGGLPAPAVIFANWRELLDQISLTGLVRRAYVQAIERYLDYCRFNGQSVQVQSARDFMSDARRRGLVEDEANWKEALNWYYAAGRKGSAPQPEGVPSLGRADTGSTAWESRLIERLRLKHYSWRTEQTYEP